MVCLRGESLTHHTNQMKLFNAIVVAAVIGTSFIAANPAEASQLVDLDRNLDVAVNDDDPSLYYKKDGKVVRYPSEKNGGHNPEVYRNPVHQKCVSDYHTNTASRCGPKAPHGSKVVKELTHRQQRFGHETFNEITRPKLFGIF